MKLVSLRRISQVLFLAVFVALLLLTELRGSPRGGAEHLGWPVRWLLELDPLLGLVNALATHSLYRGMLWGLLTLLLTMFFGRFFCGWVCPLGTLNHWLSGWRSHSKLGRRRLEANRYRRWQVLKYWILAVGLGAAACGSAVLSWLDPIALLFRGTALSLWPTLNYALNSAIDRLMASDWPPVHFLGLGVGFALKDTFLSLKEPYYRQAFWLGLVLVVVLGLNLRVTRFWCRALCPLGALLGLVSRWSVFGLEKRPSQCGDCNRCLLDCQGGDDPLPGVPWKKAECHLCLNCVDACPEAGIRFTILQPAARPQPVPSLERRHALASLAGGVALVPAMRSMAGRLAEAAPARLRPPGSLAEDAFLARCVRCGECMKVCPNHALQPALLEGGLEGLWTPVLAPRLGYCEPNCALCGDVCPTGAIWAFSVREKGWTGERVGEPIRIGTAFYDRGRCLPWAMGQECIVCEEWCPTSPKAIYLRVADVPRPDGTLRALRQPYVNPSLCVGCGACEHTCPVKDQPAIRVSSIGESRSKTNQMLLERAPAGAPELLPAQLAAGSWQRSGTVKRYAASELWQYVDGDAERYLKAGLEETMTARYRHRTGTEAVVDVHRMHSAAAAAGLFQGEPAQGSRSLMIGDAARDYGQSLTLVGRRCFVRVTAYEAPRGRELEDLARAVAAQLPR